MRQLAGELARESGCQIEVLPVVNELFGETVTVSGLLAGEDVLGTLAGEGSLGEIVFLPRAMFAQPPEGAHELLTLDGLSVGELEERLGRSVRLAGYLSKVWEQIRGDP
jgi:NifB/MoaA-like Fe-S oxidoreductase